jgi:hypothetical protein
MSLSGSPFKAQCVENYLSDMAMDVAGRSLYYDSDFSMCSFALDGMTGALTPLSGAGFPTKLPGQISTLGRFLYIPDDFFGGIYNFSIDPITSKIIALNYFPTQGLYPSVMNVDPSQHFLYTVTTAPYTGNLQLEIYSIDSNTGNLILSSTIPLRGPQPTISFSQLIVIG